MSKMIDDRTLGHWRALDLLFVLTKLGCYAKRDCTFRPIKASKTVRYHVNANGRDWEFLLTGPKFWDTRAGKGGGGAIDLTMYLFQLDFRHAVRTLNDALADLAANQLTLNYVGMSWMNPEAATTPEFGVTLNHAFLAHAYPGNNTFKIEWHNEPYMQGAFRLLLAGQYNYNAALAFQYTVAARDDIGDRYKHVMLAGESTFFLDGWIEGPLYSAVNSATAVLYGILGDDTSTLRTREVLDRSLV